MTFLQTKRRQKAEGRRQKDFVGVPLKRDVCPRGGGLGWLPLLVFLTLLLFSLFACAQNPNYVKGQSLARQGKWEEAAASYKEAVRAEPKNSKYRRELALAQKALGNHYYSLGQKNLQEPQPQYSRLLAAKAHFQKALELDPQHKGAKEGLAQSVLIGDSLQKARDEAFANGKKAQEAGDWNAARQDFQRALGFDSEYVPAREALSLSEKMLSVEALFKEAQKAESQGDKQKAKELYAQAAALLPEYTPAQKAYQKLAQEEQKELAWQRLTLAQVLIKNKRWAEAQKVLEEAQRLDEASPPIKKALYTVKMKRAEELTARGDKLFAARKYVEALNFYRQALALAPDFKGAVDGLDYAVGAEAEVHYQRAQTYRQKNLWGNAAAELKICQSWVPQYKDTPELSALFWGKIKETLPQKPKERPSPSGISGIMDQPYLFKAKEWEDKGDTEKAVEDYCRAMALDPRLNLWPKIFELKGFDPEKVKQILAVDAS